MWAASRLGGPMLPPGDGPCSCQPHTAHPAGCHLPWQVPCRCSGRSRLCNEVAARPLGIPDPLKQPWHSLHRTLEPLETEGAARSMLSSFLPPVPSLPSDPPEHFPLRKTGERDRQVGTQWELVGRTLGVGWLGGGLPGSGCGAEYHCCSCSLRAQPEAALQAQEVSGAEEKSTAQKGERPTQSPAAGGRHPRR